MLFESTYSAQFFIQQFEHSLKCNDFYYQNYSEAKEAVANYEQALHELTQNTFIDFGFRFQCCKQLVNLYNEGVNCAFIEGEQLKNQLFGRNYYKALETHVYLLAPSQKPKRGNAAQLQLFANQITLH